MEENVSYKRFISFEIGAQNVYGGTLGDRNFIGNIGSYLRRSIPP